MAIDDIDTLRDEIPGLFANRPIPPGWEEDWHIIPIDDPELDSRDPSSIEDYEEADIDTSFNQALLGGNVAFAPESEVPDFAQRSPFPGAPLVFGGTEPPPPDALAFYLPFHYFHPDWWGVYLVLERVRWLARQLEVYSGNRLSSQDSFAVARLFLYGHEAFHHSVESFATRLEITHRVPLYIDPFERYFRQWFGTSACTEEALATAHGYRKVRDKAFKSPNDSKKRRVALEALLPYIRSCPPGYAKAVDLLENGAFMDQRAWLAEENHRFALPNIEGRDPAIWHSSPHAFTGISRVTSRVNYLIRRGSPLAFRYRLGLRYFRFRDVTRRLQEVGCTRVRQGKGSHEIWQGPGGRFPVPYHASDVPKGLLAKIIKEAGFKMSVSEFMGVAAVV